MRNRLAERTTDFLSAYERLKEALAQPEDSFLRDATIQRFEFTYELAWKAIKLWWSELHRMRNLTSHTYDEAQAILVYHFIKRDGVRLFSALATQVQSWKN